MNAPRRPLVLPAGAWLLGSAWVLNSSEVREAWLILAGLILMGALRPIGDHGGPSCIRRLGRSWTLVIVVLALISGGVVAEGSLHRWRRSVESVASRVDPDGGVAFQGTVVGRIRQRHDGSLTFRLRVRDPSTILRVRLRGESLLERQRVLGLLPGDRVGLWCHPYLPANPRLARPSERPRGADLYVSLKSGGLLTVLKRGGPRPVRALTGWQNRLAARLDRRYTDDPVTREILSALLLGRRGSVGGEATAAVESLRKAGVGHLLAISGLHVGWIAGVVVLIVARTQLPWIVRSLLLATAVGAFALLVGPSPSVRRAGGFFLTSYLAVAGGRRGDPLNTLSWLALVFVIEDPWLLRDIGFQLTFVATAAIVALAPALSDRLPGPAVFRLPLAVSLVSYGATAPLVALHFARLPLVGILANLVAVPMAMMATATGYVSLLFGPVGGIAARLATITIHAMVAASRLLVSFPYSVIEVTLPSSLTLLLFCGLALYWGCTAQKQFRRLAVFAVLAVVGLHVGGPPGAPPLARKLDRPASAHILDIGQGQAIVLADRAGRTMLFDAPGADPDGTFPAGASARVVLPWLRRHGVRRLQVLAISHAHLDHAGGLPFLIGRFPIEELWLPPGWHRSIVLREIAAQLRSRGGAVRQINDNENARMGALHFRGLHGGRPAAATNEGSLGLTLFHPGSGLLIPGDFGITTEENLLARRTFETIDLLVAGHHGSRHSSGQRWLEALAPRQIAVSCGRNNRFGHPHAEFLDRARSIRATLRRTDQIGTLSYALYGAVDDSVWRPIVSGQEFREGYDEGQRYKCREEDRDGSPGETTTTGR